MRRLRHAFGGSWFAAPAATAAIAACTGSAWAACIAPDLDASGVVDGSDLGALLSAWGTVGGLGPADFDGSGAVDAADLGVLLVAWGDVPQRACLSIATFGPASGSTGDEVLFDGTFPDADPANYSLIAKAQDGAVVPFEVTAVTPNLLTARVGPYPASVTSGTFTLELGEGNLVPIDQLPAGFAYGAQPWVWTSSGTSATSSTAFIFDPPSMGASAIFFGTIDKGGLVVQVSSECIEGAAFDVWLQARQEGARPTDPVQAVGLRIPLATLASARPPLACATSLCGVISAIYLAQTPNSITGDCTIQLPAEGFELGSYVDAIDVNSGAFVVGVDSP